MDKDAEKRIEERLAATFRNGPPASSFASDGLQTSGSFFPDAVVGERPPSPYTSLFLHNIGRHDPSLGKHMKQVVDGEKHSDRDGKCGLQEGNGENCESGVKRRRIELSDCEENKKENGDMDDEDDEEESGSDSASSGDSGSEESRDENGKPSFRRRIDDNRAYQAKRMKEEGAKPG